MDINLQVVFRGIYYRQCILLTECSGCGVQRDCTEGAFSCEAGCGIIMSPGMPASYPTNINCHWTITVDHMAYIKLTFTEFDIFEDILPPCARDKLQIRGITSYDFYWLLYTAPYGMVQTCTVSYSSDPMMIVSCIACIMYISLGSWSSPHKSSPMSSLLNHHQHS